MLLRSQPLVALLAAKAVVRRGVWYIVAAAVVQARSSSAVVVMTRRMGWRLWGMLLLLVRFLFGRRRRSVPFLFPSPAAVRGGEGGRGGSWPAAGSNAVVCGVIGYGDRLVLLDGGIEYKSIDSGDSGCMWIRAR